MAFDRSAIAAQNLRVWVKDPKTKQWVLGWSKPSSLDDVALKKALAMPQNAGALASGWKVTPDGSVYRMPVAAAPIAPAPIAPAPGVPAAPVAPAPVAPVPPLPSPASPNTTTGTKTQAFDRTAIAAKYLHVRVLDPKTNKWGMGQKLVTRMSDDEIRAALGLKENGSALASGWIRLSDGTIKKGASGPVTGGPKPPASPLGEVITDPHRPDGPGIGPNPLVGYVPPVPLTSTVTTTPQPPTTTTAPPPATPPKPTTAPQPGYEWKFVNGQWVQSLTSIDTRDADYQREIAPYAQQRDVRVAEQEARRATLPSLYNRGAADIRTGYDRSRYDSNAELARRGIVRSGEYQKRGSDRLIQQTKQSADLDRQYGSGAQSEIAARLADINAQYGIQQASALQSAKDRYPDMYPASTYLQGASA